MYVSMYVCKCMYMHLCVYVHVYIPISMYIIYIQVRAHLLYSLVTFDELAPDVSGARVSPRFFPFFSIFIFFIFFKDTCC